MNYHLIQTDSRVISFHPETYAIHVFKDMDAANTFIAEAHDDRKTVHPTTPGDSELDIQAANICMCETCNLACTYCFFHSGTFDRTGGRMLSLETLIDTYHKLKAHSKSGLKSLGFYGGEPLMNFEVIRDFVEYVEKESDHKISFGVITNGTLITNEMVDFFNKHKFYVSISLDGTKKYNDKCRIAKNGKSSFDMVMETLKLLKDKQFLLSSQSTLANDFFRDYKKGTVEEYFSTYYNAGFDNIIPVTADLKDGYTDQEYENMKAFFEDVVDYSIDCLLDENRKYQPPVFIAKMISNLASKRYEGECQAGRKFVFVTVTGDIYPCQMHYMCDVEKMSCGNEIRKKETMTSRYDIEECRDCYCKNICAMWCPGGSLVLNFSEKSVIPARCLEQKAILDRIIIRLADVRKDPEMWKKFTANLVDFSLHYSVANYLGEC
jgi:uncharacterized protein